MSDLTYSTFREHYLSMISPELPGFATHFDRFSDESVIESLFTVSDKLIDNAKKFNLTSILEPGEIIRKHLIDSLIPLGILLSEGIAISNILDVGTGAGFPLLPWACALKNDDISLTGMDATAKKISHILEARDAAALPHLTALQGRAEELASTAMRESFTLVTARAVADLPVLMELCAPFVTPGGYFAALKGHAEEEVKASARAASVLGLEIVRTENYLLPGGDARSLVLCRKMTPTPHKYPRRYADITKKPL
ncbi:MAG: 16S rRNA (guanine(527)-N(7))-methyltransferase RsmG [Clostridia bacterium]|nr:16S rRNA (guanine(527)-N(7))-methyltransferase RsmG [Clostridia bacterium]